MGQTFTSVLAPNYGNYHPPPRTGDSPYTRTGELPPKLQVPLEDRPHHLTRNRMSLQMHLLDERERTSGMTPAEREWRKQWVLDQKLHPDEPIRVEAVYRHLNPLRRLYRYPFDKLFEVVLEPKLGLYWGTYVRQTVPKAMLAYFTVLVIWYHLKYEASDWTRRKEQHYTPYKELIADRKRIEEELPGVLEKADPPKVTMMDYADFGFKGRLAELNLEETIRPW